MESSNKKIKKIKEILLHLNENFPPFFHVFNQGFRISSFNGRMSPFIAICNFPCDTNANGALLKRNPLEYSMKIHNNLAHRCY